MIYGALTSSAAIFIEAKHRRSELAMYVFPKAVHSLYLTATSKKLIPSTPMMDVAFFSVAFGVLMHFFENKKHLSPMVTKVLEKLFV